MTSLIFSSRKNSKSPFFLFLRGVDKIIGVARHRVEKNRLEKAQLHWVSQFHEF